MDFVEKILPGVDAYFSLVIATNAAQVTPLHYDENKEYSKKHIFDRLLNSNFLLRLFTENYDGTMGASMIEGIPIGLDLHTPFVRPLSAWVKIGEFGPPAIYEQTIQRLMSQSTPIDDRLISVDDSWLMQMNTVYHGIEHSESLPTCHPSTFTCVSH